MTAARGKPVVVPGAPSACAPVSSDRQEDARDAEAGLARYVELRALARRFLVTERPNHTLAATDLAHEVWLRLADAVPTQDLPLAEFRRLAATAMRHALVDHARRRGRQKRGGAAARISLDALELATAGDFEDLLAVDDAIERLATRDPALAELVRLRFFAGLTVDETAKALGTSPRSVDRDWTLAKALLHGLLQ